MITVRADNADWDGIAALTGDRSWNSSAMRAYFERTERCQYRPHIWGNPSGHGFAGWLPTDIADPFLLAHDRQLQRAVFSAIQEVGLAGLIEPLIRGRLDPNDWRVLTQGREGLFNIPFSAASGRRAGTREYIQATAQALPNNLIVKTNALVTRVLLEDGKAIGVEYLDRPYVYRADARAPQTSAELGPRVQLRCSRDVVLAAGAFNSPQLLMLSGIGPRQELSRHHIRTLVDLPGVGQNLQDRYEACVVTRMKSDFRILRDCSFHPDDSDPCFAAWQRSADGVYATNGTLVAIIARSAPVRPEPDLFIFGVPGYFRGYYPGYSQMIRVKDCFTWCVLKAHTRNRAGTVRLRSADPRDTPLIDFHYFSEGGEGGREDLDSVVAGMELARRMNLRISGPDGIAAEELVPGPAVATQADLARFVAQEAWGHHASCSNRMGAPGDPMAVVDSRFRVRGVRGLRVVDASVFPRIPGFFIVTPIYMISEKASDTILEDAAGSV
jgi:choline dehydrogenase